MAESAGPGGQAAVRDDGPGNETAAPTGTGASALTAPAAANPAPQAAGVPATRAQGPQSPDALSGQVLPPKRKKRRIVLPLILLGAIGGGGYAGYEYLTDWRFIVSTDDAYVKADVSIIAAKVSGYLSAVPVVENTHVKAGQILATIDDGDYRNAVQAAQDKVATQQATVERLGRQVEAQKAMVEQAQAQLVAVQADTLRANLAFDRASSLARNEYTTKATLDQARADKDRGAANIAAARATITSAKATIAVLLAQQNEARHTQTELQTALAQARRDLAFTSVKAPFDGVVGNRAAQPGQYVTPGTRLMALVPMQSAYVEANFKETQLGSIRPGQPVDITVDAYGGRTIRGSVESFAPAAGQQFSLLPPENATGNFTKIVQRVPVRIKIPADVAQEGILRPGLSVVASVRTRDERLAPPSLVSALGLDTVAASLFGIGSSVAHSAARHDLPGPHLAPASDDREAQR